MADYVLVYQGGSMPESPEEQAQVMAAWEAWFTSLGGAVKDPGNPFTGTSKTVAPDGAISDGGGGTASGYTILTAESIEAAAEMAAGCPVLQGGASITVHETFEVM